MRPTTQGRWKLLYKHPKGHRFFEDLHNPGKIAIADDSGYYPDQTDCGVLYLDTTRDITPPPDASMSVPLVDERGERSSTIAGVSEAREIQTRFNVGIDWFPL